MADISPLALMRIMSVYLPLIATRPQSPSDNAAGKIMALAAVLAGLTQRGYDV